MEAFLIFMCVVFLCFAYIGAQHGDIYKSRLEEEHRRVTRLTDEKRTVQAACAAFHKELDVTRAARDRAIKSAVKWHKACKDINDILSAVDGT